MQARYDGVSRSRSRCPMCLPALDCLCHLPLANLVTERSAISLYFSHHPSARRSFLKLVQQVSGPECCITPAATPAGYAVDDQPALVGSHEVAHRTGTTVLEIDCRAYNETTSITDPLDSDLALSSWVEGPHQDVQNPGTGQHCAVPPRSTDADPFPDPFAISDDLGKPSYAQPAGEEDGSISISAGAAGSDQLGTRSLQHSERRTAEPPPFFYHADDCI